MHDQYAVRDVFARYSRAVDRRDWELMRSCYHEDAVDDHGFTVSRRDEFIAISQQMEGSLSDLEFHFVTRGTVNILGDQATAESYCIGNQLLTRDGSTTHSRLAGRLLDRLEQREGEWRITNRRLIMDWTRTDTIEVIAMKDVPRGTSTADDPSFQFFPLGHHRSHYVPPSDGQDYWVERARVESLVVRASRAMDRRSVRALIDCYTEDAQITIPGFRGGTEELAAYVTRDVEEAVLVSSHLNGTSLVRFDKGLALSETYVQIVYRAASETTLVDRTMLGRFLDQAVVENGEWRLRSRELIVDWVREDPVERQFALPPGTALGRRDLLDHSFTHFS